MTNNLENTRIVTDPELHAFIRHCRETLGYKYRAKILISDDHAKAKEMGGMGAYMPDINEIWILRGNRVRADWYRSLAHELVHHAQRESGKVLDGTTGSDCENDANSKAGQLLRSWFKDHPEIFD
jgi:hypothetical protein